jgi:hypothetical protein
MYITDLAILALTALLAGWRYPGLRVLGALLCIAVAVLPFTNEIAKPDRMFVFIPLDIFGGIMGVVCVFKFKEKMGWLFFGTSLAAMFAHFAFALRPLPHLENAYIGALNGLFILSCLCVGGSGLARLHSHLFRGSGGRHPRHRARSGA